MPLTGLGCVEFDAAGRGGPPARTQRDAALVSSTGGGVGGALHRKVKTRVPPLVVSRRHLRRGHVLEPAHESADACEHVSRVCELRCGVHVPYREANGRG